MHLLSLKLLTLRMDHAKLPDVLTLLPVSHAILPRAVCFVTTRPVNHAICSYIDSSGYASGPMRERLFIDYIVIDFIARSYISPRRSHMINEFTIRFCVCVFCSCYSRNLFMFTKQFLINK